MKISYYEKRKRNHQRGHRIIWLLVIATILLGVFIIGNSQASVSTDLISPGGSDLHLSAHLGAVPTPTPAPIQTSTQQIDVLVGKYADKFGTSGDQRSFLRAQLHCLLYKESRHWSNTKDGDNGMAGGPLQFWEATYKGFRRQMTAQHLTDHVGSRYNLEDSIETTAWALVTGHELNWGPIVRGECL